MKIKNTLVALAAMAMIGCNGAEAASLKDMAVSVKDKTVSVAKVALRVPSALLNGTVDMTSKMLHLGGDLVLAVRDIGAETVQDARARLQGE